jgi:nickel-dependent lactate racemase
MMDPASALGEYATNPARQDIEAIGQRIGVHFALNAILNAQHQIVFVLAGEPRRVMEQGVPLSRQVCQVPVSAPFDLVVVSPGGHPKDINLYQAQKGLGHAVRVMRPGGWVLLAAACPEGTGSRAYEDWVIGKRSPAEVIERFRSEGFRIGPHKAFQLARDSNIVHLQLYSEMPADFVRQLLLEPVDDPQKALDAALALLPPEARVGLLPRAGETIPYLKQP